MGRIITTGNLWLLLAFLSHQPFFVKYVEMTDADKGINLPHFGIDPVDT